MKKCASIELAQMTTITVIMINDSSRYLMMCVCITLSVLSICATNNSFNQMPNKRIELMGSSIHLRVFRQIEFH